MIGRIARAAGPITRAGGLAYAGYSGAELGILSAQSAMDETEKAIATPGALVTAGGQIDPTRTDPAYQKFMSKWKISRFAAGLLSSSALTTEELAMARLDPAARERLGEEDAAKFQGMPSPPETESQRKHREAMFPQLYSQEEIGAMAGMQRTGPGSFFLPYEAGTNRLGRVPAAPHSPNQPSPIPLQT